MVEISKVSIMTILENEAGCLLMIGFHNILYFTNVRVIQGFHNLVLSSNLLIFDRDQDFDDNFLTVSFVCALKNVGVPATSKLLVNDIILHISLYKYEYTPI